MFILSTLVYPLLLALLCLGAGLLVERLSGVRLPGALLLSLGVAALIGATQLLTYVPAIAPATPVLIALLAASGLILSRAQLRGVASRARARPEALLVAVIAYAAALAPVLLSGRPTFSSFMALADSAVHMMGADYLIHHGQSYGHLDLTSSYGQFVKDYYGTAYPSGADTLFGASALFAHVPLIWAFQPFNAFMLATASGPALVLARQIGLPRRLAGAAAITVVLPALVYGYELIGSVKEITALSMLLCSGSLVVRHRDWLGTRPAGGIPLALVLAAGISALGAAFGVWALAAVVVLAAVLVQEVRTRRLVRVAALRLVGVAALVGIIAVLPTLSHVSQSFSVAGDIASTSNPGNLHVPLRAIQVLGVWLDQSYKLEPRGTSLDLTHALIVLVLLGAALGCVQLLRTRAFALAGWLGLILIAWWVVSESVATWASAKTLVLTSPAVVLLAWGGVGLLLALPRRTLGRALAGVLALALVAGVLVSDALQYRASNLAPTARYEELARVDARFSGQGPALVADFDEYSLYVLRHLDVGGPDFVYPPPALASAAGGYGRPVDLDRVRPSALVAFPLIVVRRDPSAPRPPSAYELAWQGRYYQVWRRRPGTRPALVHRALAAAPSEQCAQIAALAATAPAAGRSGRPTIVAAAAPQVVPVELAHVRRPAGWARLHHGVVMKRAGTLRARVRVPHSGVWEVWVKGQIMPTATLRIDGRPLAQIAGELDGNSLVTGAAPPARVRLAAGKHVLSISRGGSSLAPGSSGTAYVAAVFLTPAGTPAAAPLRAVPAASWRTLCGRQYEWAELLRSSGRAWRRARA